MAFAWDQRISRYRDTSTGRLVSARTIRRGVDAVADASSRNMAALSQHLREGTISVLDWEKGMRQAIKVNELAQIMAAHGGRNAMMPSDWGYAGSVVKAQYQYLQNFAAEIVNGQQPLNGRLLARAAMYGAHGRTSFEATRARDAAEGDIAQEERNILHAAESCASCVAETARGWVPQGSLSLPGTRSCLANCACSISRRQVRRRNQADLAESA